MPLQGGADGMSDLVRVSGDDEAERRIQALALHLSDLRNFWPLVVPVFTSWMRRQFDSEGEFGGQRWQALAPATVDRKRALGQRLSILQATGQLKQAASKPQRRATPRSLVLTIDDSGPAHGPILQYHQKGTDRMPARPLVFGSPLPTEAQAELQAVADRYVHGLLSRL